MTEEQSDSFALYGPQLTKQDVDQVTKVADELIKYIDSNNLRPTIFISAFVTILVQLATGSDSSTKGFRKAVMESLARAILLLRAMG